MSRGQKIEKDATYIYDAYLVRLWRDSPRTPCRASAQSVRSGETVRFATLQALFSFLQARTASVRQKNPDDTRDLPDHSGSCLPTSWTSGDI